MELELPMQLPSAPKQELDRIVIIADEIYMAHIRNGKRAIKPMIVDPFLGEQISFVSSYGTGPMESSLRDALNMLGVNEIQIEIDSLKDKRYVANMYANGISIGQFHLEEILFYILTGKAKLLCLDSLLNEPEETTLEYTKIKDIKVRKTPHIYIPSELKEFELLEIQRKRESDEDFTYDIFFNRDGTKLVINTDPENVPFFANRFIKNVSNEDYYLERREDSYRSFRKLLKKMGGKVTRVIDASEHSLYESRIEQIVALGTFVVGISKEGKEQLFVMPPYIAIPLAIEKKRIFVGNISKREEKPYEMIFS
ncbi:MAG: hypothetical protein J7K73_01500 [Nanoarchaeota archaeon]|nr:hypothetical protein [Nanoarchaeota archaeon]